MRGHNSAHNGEFYLLLHDIHWCHSMGLSWQMAWSGESKMSSVICLVPVRMLLVSAVTWPLHPGCLGQSDIIHGGKCPMKAGLDILWPNLRSHRAPLPPCLILQSSHKHAHIWGEGIETKPLRGRSLKEIRGHFLNSCKPVYSFDEHHITHEVSCHSLTFTQMKRGQGTLPLLTTL